MDPPWRTWEKTRFPDVLMPMVLSFDRCIPTDLFAGNAPCLRKAAFHTMELHPDGVPALSGLTRLRLTGSRLPAAQLAAIVRTLPNLRALCIDARFGYDLPQTPPPAEFRLDELDLDIPEILSGESVGPLLRYLQSHQIRDLTTFRFDDPGWLDALVDPPRSLPITLHVYDAHLRFCNWHMAGADGYTSCGRSFEAGELFEDLLSRNVFSRVETLVLSVTLLPPDMPLLAQLTHMSLFCSRGSDLSPRAATARARPLLCPTLRVLEICGRRLGPARMPSMDAVMIPIRAGDLERFLENVFSFPPHRPPRVVLRNVSLDVSELLQDLSILGTLSISDEPLTVPAALDPRGRYRRWHLRMDE